MVGDGQLTLSDRVVRSVVWDARRSHDEIQKFPVRLRKRNFERWDRANGGQGRAITRREVNSSYGALHDATPDRILEGFIEGGVGVIFIRIQHQVEGCSSGTGMTFLPILQSVPPEAPEFRGERRTLEPVVANEEEVVRALLQPFDVPRAQRMTSLPKEAPNEYAPEDFGG